MNQAGGKNQGTGLQDELAVQQAPFVTPTEAEDQAKNQTIIMVSRPLGNDGGGGSAVVAGTVGGRRRLVAVIDQAAEVRRILAPPRRHGGQALGLATEALTKPEDPVWLPQKSTLRGPPEDVFPPGVDEAGLPAELGAIDEDPGEPFFDELPVDEWAA